MTPPSATPARLLVRFAPMVYGPTTLFALGIGVITPLIPVIATHLGASLSTAALISAAPVIGQVLANIPTGIVVSRVGERLTMVGAGLLGLVASVGVLLADTLILLTLSVFVLGVSAAAFGVARHAFMTLRVPVSFRARALSLLGGTYRLGTFAGPFVAAAILSITGEEQSTAWALIGVLAATVLLVLLGKDPQHALAKLLAADATGTQPITTVPHGILPTVSRYRGVLLRLGAAAASLSLVRSTTTVLLPLWGVLIGLDSKTIVLVIGIAGAVDFAMFYASGQLMDRYGRRVAAVPAMAVMSVAFITLSFTSTLGTAAGWFTAVTIAVGLGNGISSGLILTLGSDTAPRHDPSTFLGAWRTMTDGGGAAAPLLISVLSAAVSLPFASAMLGTIGLLGMLGFYVWIPRYAPFRRGRDNRDT